MNLSLGFLVIKSLKDFEEVLMSNSLKDSSKGKDSCKKEKQLSYDKVDCLFNAKRKKGLFPKYPYYGESLAKEIFK